MSLVRGGARLRPMVVLALLTVVAAGCGDSGDASESEVREVRTVTVEATEPAEATSVEPIVVPDTAPDPTIVAEPTTSEAAPVPVYMPAVICMNLQSAQNAIQQAGVFYSRSADASGEGRMQVNDSNWIVVYQEPPAGVLIGEGDAVLSVVKIGEPSIC